MAELRDPAALQRAMAEADRTRAWLGRRSGRSRQWISLLVSGSRRVTTDDVARDIEEALSVPTGSLFVLSDRPSGTDVPSAQGLAS